MSKPKIKLAYFDGIKEQLLEEGENSVLGIVVKDGVATIYFEDERQVMIYSPYMKVFSYYEAP